MSETPHRRNPLRLIVNKDTQLRILWIVLGAVLVCMGLTVALVHLSTNLVWTSVMLVSIGTFVSIWVSRWIAGPLYRIEKDIEALLTGAAEGARVRLRQGDHLQHLADLVNQLIERTRK